MKRLLAFIPIALISDGVAAQGDLRALINMPSNVAAVRPWTPVRHAPGFPAVATFAERLTGAPAPTALARPAPQPTRPARSAMDDLEAMEQAKAEETIEAAPVETPKPTPVAAVVEQQPEPEPTPEPQPKVEETPPPAAAAAPAFPKNKGPAPLRKLVGNNYRKAFKKVAKPNDVAILKPWSPGDDGKTRSMRALVGTRPKGAKGPKATCKLEEVTLVQHKKGKGFGKIDCCEVHGTWDVPCNTLK